MDIVFIRDLKIQTVIGVFEWERSIKQTVAFDLEMAADNTKAAATDQIEDALDYKSISDRVIEYVESNHFQLVETLAEKVAALIREEFSVPWVRLRLSKPGAIKPAKDVGVLIERGEKP